MKEFEKLKYEIDLISKGKHNQEFTGVYQRLTELGQALQLQQAGVSGSNCCKQCKKEIDTQFRFCSIECKQYYYR